MLALTDNWKFIREDVVGAEAIRFDDSRWQSISLPHTWNALDGQDGGNDYFRGVGWYRKKFAVNKSFASKDIYLKFGAASIVARVFVNGKFVGEHRSAFGAFCFNVSRVVLFGRKNVVAVQVNNAPDSTIPPLRGDFTTFGGLYRGVHLLALNKMSIAPDDYASSGVYVRQDRVDKESAALSVTTKLKNNTNGNANLLVRCSIRDNKGNRVAHRETRHCIGANSRADALNELVMNNPRLWNGINDPYLYSVRVEVFSRGVLLDKVTEPLGFRFFSVDANKGFFLNGEPYKLYGVNRHQDRENKGWAIGATEHREDFFHVKEIGANAVRLAHYQHAEEFYSLCDSGGIVVWPEIALVDFVSGGDAFRENCRNQLRELIKQNCNHPSIFCWGLFNELIPDQRQALYESLVTELNALAQELDPVRPTIAASRSMYDGSVGVNRIADLIGFNIYRGWYEPDPNDFAVYVDDMHKRFPEMRISVGEYGAGASIRHHEHPARLHPTAGKWHPEEWQSFFHEVIWKAIARRDFLWGSFVWNMFDFASDSRSEGDRNGINDKGLVTHDRKTRKDAFYWYKANWNPEPMVHITEKRFSPRPKGTVTVKVYSNAPTVELFQDGTSLGTQSGEGRIFLWKNVELQSAKHEFIARAEMHGRMLADTCSWLISQN